MALEMDGFDPKLWYKTQHTSATNHYCSLELSGVFVVLPILKCVIKSFINIRIKLKGKIVAYRCENISVAVIGDWFIAYISVYSIGNGNLVSSCMNRKAILVRFDNDPFIITRASTTVIDWPNFTFIFHLNKTPLLHGGEK